MEFLTNLTELTSLFLSQRKFRVSVESEMSTLRDRKAGVTQRSVLSHTQYNLYIIDIPETAGVNLAVCG
jgi:hypothetical protein